MLKVVLFLVALAVIVALAWVLAGIPGHVVASIGSFTIETSAPVAILALVVLFVAVLIVLRILRGVLRNSARRLRLAPPPPAGSGRAGGHARAGCPGGGRAGCRPQGSSTGARVCWATRRRPCCWSPKPAACPDARMRQRKLSVHWQKQRDATFLGLRGLLRQAVDRRDWPEALAIAKQAEAAHPGTVWLRQQRAELALQTENWAEALELIGPDPRRPTYYVAAADAEPDPARALSFAKQAWKQDPAFPPAALAYASRCAPPETKSAPSHASPTPGNGRRILISRRSPWRRNRINWPALQAAKRLVARNPTHPESRLLLAQVALDAGLTGEARHQIESAAEPKGCHQRRLCLLLAEIEEQERGDTEAGRLLSAMRFAGPQPRSLTRTGNARIATPTMRLASEMRNLR